MVTDKIRNEDFRSLSALNAAAASLLCVILGLYIAYRHRHAVNIYAFTLILVPLGVQVYGQFRRAHTIFNSMESLSITSRALIFDLLFWTAITNLTLLVFIAALLKHIDGLV